MAFRVAASRPHATEVQRVTSEQVALQEEAQSVRERKMALEEAMRQERSRRLQHAAQKNTHTAPRTSSTRNEKSSDSQRESAPSPQPTAAAPASPRNVDEYRRELDSANGNKEVYRLHYYTSGHINPADVHFYKAKGRVREYQRHAPSPPRLRSPPGCPQRHDEEAAEVMAIMPPPGEGTAEQWTKSALLRMQANQRTLKRIHARERREAAYAAARSGTRTTSAQRRQSEASQPTRATTPPRAPTAVAEPRHTFTAAVGGGAAPVAAAPPITSSNSWRSTFAAAATATPAAPLRWSPPRRQSPQRQYFATSPLRRLSEETSPGRSAPLRSSPFKPSLTYSSTSLHASRVEPAQPISAASLDRRATSPWRPLADSWSAPAQHAYQPIAPQSVATRTPWESRRAWESLSQRSSPPQPYKDDWSTLLSRPRAAAAVDPVSSAFSKGKAEVEVSPLTPSPSVKTAPRSGGQVPAETVAVAVSAPTSGDGGLQRPSLLAGFRMPDTVLKRDDLFQGSS